MLLEIGKGLLDELAESHRLPPGSVGTRTHHGDTLRSARSAGIACPRRGTLAPSSVLNRCRGSTAARPSSSRPPSGLDRPARTHHLVDRLANASPGPGRDGSNPRYPPAAQERSGSAEPVSSS